MGVKLAVADYDQCDHLLEAFNLNHRLFVSKCFYLSFFPCESSLRLSIELTDRGTVPEELKQSIRFQIEIC